MQNFMSPWTPAVNATASRPNHFDPAYHRCRVDLVSLACTGARQFVNCRPAKNELPIILRSALKTILSGAFLYASLIAGLVLLSSLPAVAQTISTIAGSGVFGCCADGGPATSASLRWPEGIARDGAGNTYIADWQNFRVRKVTAVEPSPRSQETARRDSAGMVAPPPARA